MRGKGWVRMASWSLLLMGLLSFQAQAVTCSCSGAHCSASRECSAGCICTCSDEVCACECLDEVKPPVRIKLPPFLADRPLTVRQVLDWLEKSAGLKGVVDNPKALDRPVHLPSDESGEGLSVAVVLAEAENQAGFRLLGPGIPLHNVPPTAALDISLHGLDPERTAGVLTWLAGREITVMAGEPTDYDGKGVTLETLLDVLRAF